MSDERSVSFAELLRRLRMDAGLTQEELAAAASLSPRSVSDLERGVHQTARKDTARLLADALNLSGVARSSFEASARGGSDARPRQETVSALARSVAATTPRLPHDIKNFTGRDTDLARLLVLLAKMPRWWRSMPLTEWPGSERARSLFTRHICWSRVSLMVRSSCRCTPTR